MQNEPLTKNERDLKEFLKDEPKQHWEIVKHFDKKIKERSLNNLLNSMVKNQKITRIERDNKVFYRFNDSLLELPKSSCVEADGEKLKNAYDSGNREESWRITWRLIAAKALPKEWFAENKCLLDALEAECKRVVDMPSLEYSYETQQSIIRLKMRLVLEAVKNFS